MTSARKRLLRPDLVVLSTGMVPTADTERVAGVLNVDLDEDGFIEILDRKNRATETTQRGRLRRRLGGRPQGARRGQHRGPRRRQRDPQLPHLGRPPQQPASEVDGGRVRRLRHLRDDVPLRRHHAGRPARRTRRGRPRSRTTASWPSSTPRPATPAASAPPTAPRWRSSTTCSDDDLFGRLALMTEGVEKPVVGFYCRECAGAAISLSGLRRDPLPRERASRRAALPGPRQRPAHRRGSAARRRRRVPRRLRRGPLPVPHRRHQRPRAGRSSPRSCWPRPATAAPARALAPVRRRPPQRRPAHPPLPRARRRRRASLDRSSTSRSSSPAPARAAREVTAVAACLTSHLTAVVLRPSTRWPRSAASASSAGSASAPAPAGSTSTAGPRRIVRLILAGEVERLLEADDVWRCSECGACTDACRMEVDTPRMLAACASLQREHGAPCAARARRRRGRREAPAPASRRIDNMAFGVSMATKGYVPKDVVGAAGMGVKMAPAAAAAGRRRPAAGAGAGPSTAAVTLPFYAGCALPQDTEAARPGARASPPTSASASTTAAAPAAAATRRAARDRTQYTSRRAGAHRLPGLRRTACARPRSQTTPLWEALVEHAGRHGRSCSAAAPTLRARTSAA